VSQALRLQSWSNDGEFDVPALFELANVLEARASMPHVAKITTLQLPRIDPSRDIDEDSDELVVR
jgi:hypothetical protein